MLNDALVGLPPMLPAARIPAALTENRLFELYQEVQGLKVAKAATLSKHAGNKKYSVEELGQAVALISQSAEDEVMKAHADLVGGEAEHYHTAMTLKMQS